jgi:Protein of unknown function (DUF2844)
MKIKGGKLALAGLLFGAVLVLRTIPAAAGLGGAPASIQADASAMAARMTQSAPTPEAQTQAYATSSFVTDKGVTVREYSASTGGVFGIAWQGPRPPDMSVLLGAYYPEYVAAAAAQKGRIGLHHSVIVGPKSVVILTGHMGNMSGRAYAPGLVPSGLDPKAVVK